MENKMNLTIYGKRRQSADGKTFVSYLTKLTKKSGEEITATVKFRTDVRPPECPANIVVDKADANLSPRKYIDGVTGEEKQSYTLWVSKYENGETYVDHSLDEF